MTEQSIQEAKSTFEAQLRRWAVSQEDQTDGYEYGKNFVESIQQVGTETLQLCLQGEPCSKHKKKV